MVLSVTRLLLLSAYCVTSALGHALPDRDCPPYRYCDGRSFQSQFQVRNKTVFCDIAINPKLRCCLPQTAHLVCYNIMVDWQFLNDGDGNYRHTTNFSQLCRAMLRKAGHRRGRYSSVSTTGGGGHLAYSDNQWVHVSDPAETGYRRITDVACGILGTG